ncbi:MAG: phage baseplate assembly protein V [Betaproteobacteria bacterium]|nr:phage baseplate assembly protein V [Betaproteobacteria bacterium]
MKRLLNAMARQAQLAASGRAETRIGIVSAYNPADYCAKVQLQPEGTETGWLPVLSPWIGETWGLFCPPSVGDQVQVEFQEGSAEAGFIVGRFFSNAQRPLAVPSGEFWLVHQSGSALKFHNDGSVEVISHANMTATVGANLTANVTGTATVTAGGKATVNAAGIDLNGGGGSDVGVVQGVCVCAFTGAPHPQISGTVTGTL